MRSEKFSRQRICLRRAQLAQLTKFRPLVKLMPLQGFSFLLTRSHVKHCTELKSFPSKTSEITLWNFVLLLFLSPTAIPQTMNLNETIIFWLIKFNPEKLGF